MNNGVMWGIVAVLLVVIVVMAWILFALPAPAEAPTTGPTITPTSTASEEPLHALVSVASPKANAVVGKTFNVAGQAPGQWYFEASFPIQVRDKNGNLLASTHADAQSDWMTTGLVPFEASVNITDSYTGPAVLVLLRDNPSGLPENDDALEVPIIIQ